MRACPFKRRGIFFLSLLLLSTSIAWGQDPGNPDTAYVNCGTLVIEDTGGTVSIKVKFLTDNVGDTNKLSGFGFPFYITNSNPGALPVLDTTVSSTYSGSAVNSFTITSTSVPSNGGDPAVFPLQYVLGAVSFSSSIGAGTYLYANVKIRLEDTTTICIDSQSTQTVQLSFVRKDSKKYTPQWKPSCCKVLLAFPAGDATCDRVVNLGDIVYLVNFVFKGGPPPCLKRFGDSNCDQAVNLSDIVYDVNYIFKGGPKPVYCP